MKLVSSRGGERPATVAILRNGTQIIDFAGQKEFWKYFIGYNRSPRTIEEMLQNMFVGKRPDNSDRLLDFSRAVPGNLFFVPSPRFLDNVESD